MTDLASASSINGHLKPTPIVSLPMYDWPEVRTQNDALWAAIRSQLNRYGIEAPPALDCETQRAHVWRSDGLLLSQTCGLPYVSGQCADALLLGSPIYDLNQCAAGDYLSVLIVRNEDPATSLDDLRARCAAYNDADSQSGYAALLFATAPLARDGAFFSGTIEVGSHRAAIRAVAEGAADIAAIDAVSWRLAIDHEPMAGKLRVLMHTEPSPGLPLITARQNAAIRDVLNEAIVVAIDSLPQTTRAALHLRGFRPRPAGDYLVLKQRIERARQLGYPRLR